MSDVNTRLYDLDVRHQVGVSRLSSSVADDLLVSVARLQTKVEAVVGRTDVGASPKTVQASVDAVGRAAAKMAREMADTLLARADELVDYELEFQETSAKTVARRSVAHPSQADLSSELRREPVCGRLVSEWCEDVAAAAFRRVRDRLRLGVSEETRRDDVVDSVLGTAALKYKDGALGRTRSDAEGLARTVVTRATVLARSSLFYLNSNVYDREQWCSVLDGSTSSPCQSLDGKVFKVGEAPKVPAHWACRSTLLGLVVGSPAPRRETYEAWLQRQSAAVQDDVLGVTQAKLWRDGGVKLDRFVDRTGQRYTVAELRSREARAFARLG